MCMYTIMYLCFWTGNMKNISCNRSPRWRFSEAQVLVQFSELDFLRNLPLFTELFKEWSHSKQKSGIAASFMALLCSANFVSALSNLSGGTYLINTLKIKFGNLNKLYFLSAIFFLNKFLRWSLEFIRICCGLNVSVLPKFICWNPISNTVALEGGPSGKNGWLSHADVLMQNTRDLMKEIERSTPAPSVMWGHCRKQHPPGREQNFTRLWVCWYIEHGLLNVSTEKCISVIYKLPSLRYSVIASQAEYDNLYPTSPMPYLRISEGTM